MPSNKEAKKIIKIAKEHGWNVESEDKDTYRFSQYSPAGQDFSFTVAKDTQEAMKQSIIDYADDFDVDDEIQMWLEAKESGTQGIPGTRELVHDCEDIKEMLKTLADDLSKRI